MPVDQTSLFIAAGVCAMALALAMLAVWVHNREDDFLAGWMLGLLLLGGGVLLYYAVPGYNPVIVATAFTLEIIGFVVVFIAARQFTGHSTPRRPWLALCAVVPAVALPILAGRDGIGIMIYNFLAGSLLMATAVQYWRARRSAHKHCCAVNALQPFGHLLLRLRRHYRL